MKFLFLALVMMSGQLTAYADYPDAQRDRPRILIALAKHKIKVENLEFPLVRQIAMGSFTALSKIPELVEYLTGTGTQYFVTLHVIQGTFNGEVRTCIANIQENFDNTVDVSVGGCGKNFTNVFNSDEIVPLTRI